MVAGRLRNVDGSEVITVDSDVSLPDPKPAKYNH